MTETCSVRVQKRRREVWTRDSDGERGVNRGCQVPGRGYGKNEAIGAARGRLANPCTGFLACANGQRNPSGAWRGQRSRHEVQAEALGVGNECSMTSVSAEAKWAGAGELLGIVGLGVSS
jgi:hypothetical protein